MIDAALLLVAAVLAANGFLMLVWPDRHLHFLHWIQAKLERSTVPPAQEIQDRSLEKRLTGLAFIVISIIIVRAVAF